MREERFLQRVQVLIQDYSCREPLARYLRNYFSTHRNMGARDRRETRDWIFNYFRIGSNLRDKDINTRLAVANFLCSNKSDSVLEFLLQGIGELQTKNLELEQEEKIRRVEGEFPEFKLENIFPFRPEFTPALNYNEWCKSMLKQPLLWIRVRKAFMKNVISDLEENGISYSIDTESPRTISCRINSPLQNLKSFEKGWFEIQDRSSQQTRSWFKPRSGESWWDACAGSGGKSLLLLEEEPAIRLLATDLRESILRNCRERMAKTEHKNVIVLPLDITSDKENFPSGTFNGIIADVPCSGSGTWARTPEWLSHFETSVLSERFIPLQRKIISELTNHLSPGGVLIYITCSVFHSENEGNIAYLEQNLPLKTESYAYLSGIEFQADTMFIARLIRN